MVTKPTWQRIQVLLSAEQYRALRTAAASRRISMGELVREALAKEVALPWVEKRLAAVKRIGRMNLPVSD